jgi:hypothetical protein
MLPSLAIEGTDTSLKSNITASVRRHKKMSLGDLTNRFLDGISSKPEDTRTAIDNHITEVHIRTRFQVESTLEDEAEQRKSVLRLVVERNRLIHRDALLVDLNSPEECALFSARLDEQNERIRAQLAYVNSLRKVQKEALEELIRFMQTEEFADALKGARDV